MLYLTETQKDGNYSSDNVLFTSETNSVIVRFTSDWGITSIGFSLDVRSISCADRERYPVTGNQQENEYTTSGYPEENYSSGSGNHGGCESEEIEMAAGEMFQGALVTQTGSDGSYPDNACQEWKITTTENQV